MSDPVRRADAAWGAWGLLAGLYVCFYALRQVGLRLMNPFAAGAMEQITNRAFETVQGFSSDWHANTFAGSTVRKISRGMWGYDSISDVLILMLGPVSGAHFNPAVSLVMAWRRQMRWADVAPYAAAQIAGGLAGTIVAHLMFEQSALQIAQTVRSGGGQWLAEAVATFGLVLTIFGIVRFRPDSVAMAVGLYITAAYWFTASTSFANPAVTIARAFSDSFAGIAPSSVPAFIVAQLLGALAGAMLAGWLFSPAQDEAAAQAGSRAGLQDAGPA